MQCFADLGHACAFDNQWWESHGNHPNSTPRALKTARDLIGVRAALDYEETLPRVV